VSVVDFDKAERVFPAISLARLDIQRLSKGAHSHYIYIYISTALIIADTSICLNLLFMFQLHLDQIQMEKGLADYESCFNLTLLNSDWRPRGGQD
jgi:hypothetical protein